MQNTELFKGAIDACSHLLKWWRYDAFILQLQQRSPMWQKAASIDNGKVHFFQPHGYTIISVRETVPETSELKALSLFNAVSICVVFFSCNQISYFCSCQLQLTLGPLASAFHKPYDLSVYIKPLSFLQAPWTKRKFIYLECISCIFFSAMLENVPKHVSSNASNL